MILRLPGHRGEHGVEPLEGREGGQQRLVEGALAPATELHGRPRAAIFKASSPFQHLRLPHHSDIVSQERITAPDVARILGVSRDRVGSLTASAPDFPPSQVTSGGYRAWARAATEAWAASHPERGPAYTKPDLPITGRAIRPPRQAAEAWADVYPDRDRASSAPGRPVVGRMTPETAEVLRLACAESEGLSHSWVGADHLLLALLRRDSPGPARAALESLGLNLEEVSRTFVNSMGDPFEPHDRGLAIPPATQQVLELANVEALDLRDEQVGSEHVLLALARDNPPLASSLLWLFELRGAVVRERVLAITEGAITLSALPSPEPPPKPKPIPRPQGLSLAPTPLGRDPWQRRPWASVPFPGDDIGNGGVPRQHHLDRDGNPVLTVDGRLVATLLNEDGMCVLDEEGWPIITAVEAPPGFRAVPRPECSIT